MTADLVAFLRSCLDIDEQVAREALAKDWRNAPTSSHHEDASGPAEAVFGVQPGTGLTVVARTGPRGDRAAMVAAEHIARHDPARVLAEVDAKRRIIAEHEPSWSSGEPEYDHHHEKAVSESGRTRYIEVRDNDPVPPYWCSCCQSSAPCLTLRLLALPYTDHHDYQPEWAPES